jgi:hypothetical protein
MRAISILFVVLGVWTVAISSAVAGENLTWPIEVITDFQKTAMGRVVKITLINPSVIEMNQGKKYAARLERTSLRQMIVVNGKNLDLSVMKSHQELAEAIANRLPKKVSVMELVMPSASAADDQSSQSTGVISGSSGDSLLRPNPPAPSGVDIFAQADKRAAAAIDPAVKDFPGVVASFLEAVQKGAKCETYKNFNRDCNTAADALVFELNKVSSYNTKQEGKGTFLDDKKRQLGYATSLNDFETRVQAMKDFLLKDGSAVPAYLNNKFQVRQCSCDDDGLKGEACEKSNGGSVEDGLGHCFKTLNGLLRQLHDPGRPAYINELLELIAGAGKISSDGRSPSPAPPSQNPSDAAVTH